MDTVSVRVNLEVPIELILPLEEDRERKQLKALLQGYLLDAGLVVKSLWFFGSGLHRVRALRKIESAMEGEAV